MRKALVVMVVAAAASLGLVRSYAEAHGGTGGNYRSTVLSVEPSVPGVDVVVVGRDDQLLLTNKSGRELTVLGYQGEPYLRFSGAGGVFANDRSPAYYLNNDRYAVVQLPSTVDAGAAPEWVQVAAGDSYSWHDHRIHWMSPNPPPAVQGNLGRRQKIFDWTVPIVAGEPLTVRGELEWVPSIDASLWFGMAAIVVLLGIGTVARSAGSLDRGCRLAASLSAGLAALAIGQSALVLVGFRESSASLLDAATMLNAIATAALAVRAWFESTRAFAKLLAAGTACLVFVAGVLHADLVTAAAVEGPADQVLPAIVAAEIVLGATSVGALLIALRRSRAGGALTGEQA